MTQILIPVVVVFLIVSLWKLCMPNTWRLVLAAYLIATYRAKIKQQHTFHEVFAEQKTELGLTAREIPSKYTTVSGL